MRLPLQFLRSIQNVRGNGAIPPEEKVGTKLDFFKEIKILIVKTLMIYNVTKTSVSK